MKTGIKHEQGWVYILTNPSFREDWVKIGKSSRPVDVRSKELDNTAVPLPFEIFATLKTAKYEIVERKIHKAIDSVCPSKTCFGRGPATSRWPEGAGLAA